MADFLTIDGDPIDVQTQNAGFRTVLIGEISRAFAGNVRVARRDQHIEVPLTTAPLTPAAAGTFLTYDDGALHVLNGALVGDVDTDAYVSVDEASAIPVGSTSFKLALRFTLRLV